MLYPDTRSVSHPGKTEDRMNRTVDGSLLFLFFLEKCRKQDQ